jgi:hypothetical protein
LELSDLSFIEFISLQFAWIPLIQMLLLTVGYWFAAGKLRLLLITATVLLWPFASGHSTYPRYGGYISIGLDMMHLLAVSVWMGGLLALIIMLPKENNSIWFTQAGTAYSKWAFWSMIVIILSGIERVKVKFFMPPDWKKENTAFSLGNGAYKVTGNFLHAAGSTWKWKHGKQMERKSCFLSVL